MRLQTRHLARVLCAVIVTALVACGGGGGGTTGPADTTLAPQPSATPTPRTPAAEPAISYASAHRFLRQTTFGPIAGDVALVRQAGYSAWIDAQFSRPPSFQLPYMDSLPPPQNAVEGQIDRMDAWFRNALLGEDQLRQRVAFALSQVMVVSDRSSLFDTPRGLAWYYDILVRHAFGNFRELMEDVTLSPAMGVYLSMLGNEKPDLERNIRPDENYARELMQLFTIGLVELDLDGTIRLGTSGQPIPTYNQDVIEGFAHVYTGWTFGGSPGFTSPSFDFTRPMEPFEEFHDTGEKLLLGGEVLPASQTARQDLEAALDNIFEHPNVAPFVSRQLIQRLVTSNPSPEYVQRVASVFANDGFGVRGNLAAVTKAILLDAEARADDATETSGKLTEPLLRLTAVWRAFGAAAPDGRYRFGYPDFFFAQAPLRAPSVFNFYRPDYVPPGEFRSLGLVSPEMQITNETTSSSVNNYLAFAIFLRHNAIPGLADSDIVIDVGEDVEFAGDSEVLVDRIAQKLTGGVLSGQLRSETIALVELWEEPTARTVEAIHSIASSPEFAVLP